MPNDGLDRREFIAAAGTVAAVGAAAGGLRAAAQGSTELCFLDATELARLIHTRQVSCREVMTAHLERIERFNPRLNAIVAKLDDDECLARADAADRRGATARLRRPGRHPRARRE